jgi:GMP synthase (glutamine-hydrolysing)
LLNSKKYQKMQEKVLVLDFGSQYTQLIARRLRELGVYSEIRPCFSKFDMTGIGAVILSGGPASVGGSDAPQFDTSWLESSKVPILGICYGMQLITSYFNGKMAQGASREYGDSLLKITKEHPLFSGFSVGAEFNVWMSHGDHVVEPPKDFFTIAASKGAPIAGFACDKRQIYGLQFHPEVVHSACGKELLANFLFKIAKFKGTWTPDSMIEANLNGITQQIGNSESKIICGLSGGVDSTVAATLVSKVVGDRLYCIFVDNGLLRAGEADSVEQKLGKGGVGLNVIRVDASKRFLKALSGVSDPEEKRKIIGRVFIEVFDEEADKIGGATHLVQGTLYPDVIESVSSFGPSVTIKSHHNVGGLPERMKLSLIEPLRALFKDEVRLIGRELGLPEELINRQPFPGPGLAVRILGPITAEKLETLRKADTIFLKAIKEAGLYDKIWQAFCIFLPIRSVGVMGDGRTYEEVIALRAVHSIDGMTADWVSLPEDLLRRVSNDIINQVSGVNRVVLDISSKPPATIEWE